jgi:hypothetical protein
MNCNVPHCLICQWLCERMMHHMDTLQQAIIESAAEFAEPLTIMYRRWPHAD